MNDQYILDRLELARKIKENESFRNGSSNAGYAGMIPSDYDDVITKKVLHKVNIKIYRCNDASRKLGWSI